MSYDYSLTWTCLSAEGCERTEELKLYDRLTILNDTFFFASSRDKPYFETAQRFALGFAAGRMLLAIQPAPLRG